MIQGKSVLAIIPARGGSKGLQGKNVLPIHTKPLLEWTLIKAKLSQYCDDIVVTTDDAAIASIAEKCGFPTPFLRPDYLATDTATTYDAVCHTLSFYKESLGKTYDIICLLEPTSPLREDGDIDAMLRSLLDHYGDKDGIVSIGETSAHPSLIKKVVDGNLVSYCSDETNATRRQDLPDAYFPYGVAYILKTDTFYKEKTFYPSRCHFYKIKRYQCYEIDDIYDFLAVESVMKYEWKLT